MDQFRVYSAAEENGMLQDECIQLCVKPYYVNKEPYLHISIAYINTKQIRENSKPKIEIHAKHFLNLLTKIYEVSPIKFYLSLTDQSDLQFIFLFKYGYTFYEKFDFKYLIPIPQNIRNLNSIVLDSVDLRYIESKFWRPIKLTKFTILELIEEIEKNYPEKLEKILFILFKYKFPNFDLPCHMIFCPTQNLSQFEESKSELKLKNKISPKHNVSLLCGLGFLFFTRKIFFQTPRPVHLNLKAQNFQFGNTKNFRNIFLYFSKKFLRK